MRLILFLLALSPSLFAQNPYPQEYFQSPLDIPVVLAGTFAELRSNHFHSGLDIKTQNVEGLKVYGIADGYISRIKVAHYGYGKALYITHPNGYTSVYAHLQKFSP
ncbi:M23 family metallopeptidase [Lacinutrix neustonica]|uniref:M23 family metallopeptidase n=1 Tax=Lacinutrix neustonica TaxID=2980107 RepID=UPI0028BD7918|nr:M23 family metallopeptidase [Lacinutrix neustonica]